MRRPRHTEQERRAIIERTLTSGRTIAEIAAEEGITSQTIQSWMRAPKSDNGSFIEVPPPRATVVEISFGDGTVLRIRG
jgi:transposase-like protein